MAIITLTSDFGYNNHYAAVVKGVILSACPSCTLVDITHGISNFDIMEAAYVVRNAYPAFPPQSIHLVAVDPEVDEGRPPVLVMYRSYFFIAPDNGIISLIINDLPELCLSLSDDGKSILSYPKSFRAGRILAPVAAALANGEALENMGSAVNMKELRWGSPSYVANCLRGKIIYIDKFGNAVTNITKEEFLHLKNGRRFEIFIRNVRLKRIVSSYSDVNKADALALFGKSDHLEIAMREAAASELLGLKIHDMITIEFME